MTNSVPNPQAQQPTPKPNPALALLNALIGEWRTVGSHPLFPGATLRGRVSFDWLDGGAFLTMHSDVEQPGPPSASAVIGRDDSKETYRMLYFDERGVSRIYKMSLEGSLWKMWRESPGFSQRFTGTLSNDGNTITALWEKSSDGSRWEHDLELTYTKVRKGET